MEQLEGQPPEHEGEKYLDLLGIGHLADETIPGRDIQMRDFLDICRKDAMPLLVGLESLSPDDPRFSPTQAILRKRISKYLTPTES